MRREEIINHLKPLRQLKPDASFVAQTRQTVLATVSTADLALPHFSFRVPVWAWSFGAALILIVLVGINSLLFNGSPALSSSLNSESLQQELQDLGLDIKEVTYRQGINQTIASALTEISDSRVNHLNQRILESEERRLDELNQGNGSDIDRLLNQVIF